ncbi:unnamed protein product [Caenorhabditis angaria]|uniref:Uncharacterized protein n=1 Tax=Caenorhabditis angaria TaxID=860376 RepID=A0A9P1IUK8_9PELO|nr:unnamed protein product [Caenorhabditis angaria]
MALRQDVRDLLTTRYVPQHGEHEECEKVEAYRAGGDIDMIDGRNDEDVCLVEDRPLHGVADTPKLIAKPARESRSRDEAVKVLLKLKKGPVEQLRLEKYDYYNSRWFNTTQETELELINYVLLNPNARPSHFAIQSRRLNICDVENIILTSLLAPPQSNGQSLARFAIKCTEELGFKKLWEIVNRLKEQNDGMMITDGKVVATLIEDVGFMPKVTHRLSTERLEEYAELERGLDEHGELMSSRVYLTCSIQGKRHVQTQITYLNNGCSRMNGTKRTKYIELEQTVKCMNRRVLIAEDRNESVEFEVDEDMTSLREAQPIVEDLIDYLRSDMIIEEDSDEDEY